MDRSEPASRASLVRSAGPAQTRELGRRLGAEAAPGTMLALLGDLGAGKTQLAKGVADGLGITTIVNSPTFVLMNEHVGRLTLYHVDAYRLDDAEEALAAGLLDERQSDGLTVVEWADRLAGWLPDERLEIDIRPVDGQPMGRILSWRAFGAGHRDLAERALVGATSADAVVASS